MIPLLASPLDSLTLPDADDSRRRCEARNARIVRRAADKAAVLEAKKLAALELVAQRPA
jgi:hypothetical protein